MERFAYVATVGLMLAVVSQSTWGQTPLSTRTYVSVTGNDSNPCTSTAPCRTFARAITQTEEGGEIDALDPGGYENLKIGKSISVVGVGESGIIAPADGNGITIDGGAVVNLRGLIVEGGGVGDTGIVLTSGGYLTIEKCVVRNFKGRGIFFMPNRPTGSNLIVSDTFVVNNGGNGIAVFPSNPAVVSANFNRVESHNNGGDGFIVNSTGAHGNIWATAVDSVAFANGGAGFHAQGRGVRFDLLRSVASYSGYGFLVNSGALMYIAQSASLNNSTGWGASDGQLWSFGDNYFDTSNNTGPLLVLSKQ